MLILRLGVLVAAATLAMTPAAAQLGGAIFSPEPMPRQLDWGPLPPPEEMNVTTEDGLVLTGYRWRPRCGSHAALVFFHGNGGNRYTAAQLAAPLRRDDVDLIVASYRGYGGNPGRPSEAGLYRDAAAFVREAKRADPVRLYLFGYSLGGAVAAHSAARYEADALITLGAFSSLRSAAPRLARAFVPDWFDNLAVATALRAPWLILHGTADRAIPVAQAEMLEAAAGDNAMLVRLTGAPHNVALDQIAARIWAAVGGMSLDDGDNWLAEPADCDTQRSWAGAD